MGDKVEVVEVSRIIARADRLSVGIITDSIQRAVKEVWRTYRANTETVGPDIIVTVRIAKHQPKRESKP